MNVAEYYAAAENRPLLYVIIEAGEIQIYVLFPLTQPAFE